MPKKKTEKRPENEIEIVLNRKTYEALEMCAAEEGLTVKEMALSIIAEQVGQKKGFYMGMNFVLKTLDDYAKKP